MCKKFRSQPCTGSTGNTESISCISTQLLYINKFPKLVQGVLSISHIKNELESRGKMSEGGGGGEEKRTSLIQWYQAFHYLTKNTTKKNKTENLITQISFCFVN